MIERSGMVGLIQWMLNGYKVDSWKTHGKLVVVVLKRTIVGQDRFVIWYL